MAEKITLARVLAGDYEVAPGLEYEISEGNFGKLRTPTKAVQDKVYSLKDATASDIVPIILSDLKQYDPDNAITGMEVAAARDFFTLLTRIAKAVNPDFDPSELGTESKD